MMKKIGWLVLILIIILSTVAFSESELTFQGIPWLSDEEMAIRVLKDNNFISEEEEPIIVENEGVYIKKDETIIARPSKIENHENYCISLKGKVKKKIAGYPVNDLLLTFAFDGANTQLISVKVELDNASYTDILNKLKKVYGEGETKSDEDGITSTIWYGGNNSSILLHMIEGGDLFSLLYGRLDGESILLASNESFADMNVDPEDVSGL